MNEALCPNGVASLQGIDLAVNPSHHRVRHREAGSSWDLAALIIDDVQEKTRYKRIFLGG